jgi:hypothetical protein
MEGLWQLWQIKRMNEYKENTLNSSRITFGSKISKE